jgi:adenine-specific DNA glycosylase
VEREGAVLVRQRPAGVVNAHLWEFPNVEIAAKCTSRTKRRQLEAELGCPAETLSQLAIVRHSITRYRMTLEAFSVGLNGSTPRTEAGKWVSKDDILTLPFSSAHRRILLAALRKEAPPR